MGPGEEYWHSWVEWFKAESEQARQKFKETWPEPDGWHGFYGFIEGGGLPPWVLEQRRLIAEAAIPPKFEEQRIEDRHRVLWLIQSHMKRVGGIALGQDEAVSELYQAPDGAKWRLASSLSKGGLHLERWGE